MIFNFKQYKLNENPDTLYVTDTNTVLEWSDPDAICFLYIKDEYKDEYNEIGIDSSTILYSFPGENHPDTMMQKYKSNYPSMYEMIKKFEYIGRVWYDSKIITFWDYPESKMKLNEIISDLNDKINSEYKDFDEIDDTWRIEIVTDNDDVKYGWSDSKNYSSSNIYVKTDLIPITEYKYSGNHSELARKIHNMTPQEKEIYFKTHNDPRTKSKVSNWKKYMKSFESKQFRTFDNIILLIEGSFGGYSFVLLDIEKDLVVGTINLVVYDDVNRNPVHGMVSSVGADRGYGKYLYEFALMYLDVPIMPSRDGDVTGEAMNVWTKLYNDNKVIKETLDWEDDEFTLSIMFGEQKYYSIEEKDEIYQEHLEDNINLKEDEEIKTFNTMYSIDNESDLFIELKNKGENFEGDTTEYFDVDYSSFFENYG